MKRLIAALIAAAVSLAAFSGGAIAAEAKIGVVNISKIAKDFAKAKKLDDAIKEESKKADEQLGKIRDEIEKLKAQIRSDVRTAENEEKFAQVQRVDMMEFKYKDARKSSYEALSKKSRDAKREVYGDIVKATAAAAKEKGFDLVLQKQETFENPSADVDFAVALNAVLFYSSAVDLTDDVLKKLNKDFADAEEKAKKDNELASSGGDKQTEAR